MRGARGLTENSAFYGLMICNAAVVIFAPFTPSLSKILGTRTAVIISVILCGTINNVLFYPTNYLVYGAFLLNGIGCALLRVAALAYMTKNSTTQTLSRHNSIHWMMLTLGLMLGNGIVMLINVKTTEINDDKRYAIATAMSVVCLLAIPGYFLTQKIPENYDEILAERERASILAEVKSGPSTAGITSFPRSHEGYVEVAERGAIQRLVDMFKVLLRNETLLLLPAMFCAGVYCTAYSPIIPTAVGNVSGKTWLVSAFGICVGVGQLCGAFITGRAIDKVSMKNIAIVTTTTSILTFSMIGLVLEMGFSDKWTEWVSFSQGLILILGFFIGSCDMANNVCLSVSIGKLYTDNSDPAFGLFITVMSFSMIGWYVLSTFSHSSVLIILVLYGIVSIATAISLSFVVF